MDHAPGERDFLVRLTSRGRVTVPKPVRDALGWGRGDEIVFRLDGDQAVLTKKTARPGEDLEDALCRARRRALASARLDGRCCRGAEGATRAGGAVVAGP